MLVAEPASRGLLSCVAREETPWAGLLPTARLAVQAAAPGSGPAPVATTSGPITSRSSGSALAVLAPPAERERSPHHEEVIGAVPLRCGG